MTAQPNDVAATDAVIAVDIQRDFCPGGKLAVSDGDAVVPVMNRWLRAAATVGATIVAQRDWHPREHMSFEVSDGPWPEHCLQGTDGAAWHGDLFVPASAIVVSKGHTRGEDQYSAFEACDLGERLRRRGTRRVWVGGLALDVCVVATVTDACEEGFETHVLLEATRAINDEPGDAERAIEQMKQAGAIMEGSLPDA